MKRYVLAMRLGGALIMLGGVALTAPLLYFQTKNNSAVAQTPVVVQQRIPVAPASTPVVTGDPVSISLPNVNITMPVINGYYNSQTGQWTLTDHTVQFATPSTQPNNIAGNTLIYGHALWTIFGHLQDLKAGDQAFVTTSNGYVFTYTYTSTQAYSPENTSIFSYTGAPRLTLQTCSGLFSQNRQMYYFTYDGYKKV